MARNPKHVRANAPSFVKGRKGGISIVDCMVQVLWTQDAGSIADWPVKTFPEIGKEVSDIVGYTVPPSTIRSTAYSHSDIFQKANAGGKFCWRLTEKARKAAK